MVDKPEPLQVPVVFIGAEEVPVLYAFDTRTVMNKLNKSLMSLLRLWHDFEESE